MSKKIKKNSLKKKLNNFFKKNIKNLADPKLLNSVIIFFNCNILLTETVSVNIGKLITIYFK